MTGGKPRQKRRILLGTLTFDEVASSRLTTIPENFHDREEIPQKIKGATNTVA
jgi:hypothetical protein